MVGNFIINMMYLLLILVITPVILGSAQTPHIQKRKFFLYSYKG